MYKIEKNVPIPQEALNRGRASKYPFGSLEVNDSFYVPYTAFQSERHAIGSLTRIIYVHKKKTPERTFVYAKERDGVRVWRVA